MAAVTRPAASLIAVDDILCEVCKSPEDEPSTVLCDGCPRGYHTYCLEPALPGIPAGDWFCPHCAPAAAATGGDDGGDAPSAAAAKPKRSAGAADGAAKPKRESGAAASAGGGAAAAAGAPVKREKRKGGPRSGPYSGHAVCHRAFSKLKPGEYAPQEALMTRYYHYPHQCKGIIDITEEMAAEPATYANVLAALEYIDFPQNTNRKNVKKNNDRSCVFEAMLSVAFQNVSFLVRPMSVSIFGDCRGQSREYMESMCLGAVFSWAKRSSFGWGGGAGGGNGMIASSGTQGRPNITRLLSRYCIAERPGFAFTSIRKFTLAIHRPTASDF